MGWRCFYVFRTCRYKQTFFINFRTSSFLFGLRHFGFPKFLCSTWFIQCEFWQFWRLIVSVIASEVSCMEIVKKLLLQWPMHIHFIFIALYEENSDSKFLFCHQKILCLKEMHYKTCTILRHSRPRHSDICCIVQSVWRNHSRETNCPEIQGLVARPDHSQHCFGSYILKIPMEQERGCRTQGFYSISRFRRNKSYLGVFPSIFH